MDDLHALGQTLGGLRKSPVQAQGPQGASCDEQCRKVRVHFKASCGLNTCLAGETRVKALVGELCNGGAKRQARHFGSPLAGDKRGVVKSQGDESRAARTDTICKPWTGILLVNDDRDAEPCRRTI